MDALQRLEDAAENEGLEVTQEVRNQFFNTVLGPEKRNRVRGYGCGANWVDVPGIVTQKNGLKNQIRDLTLAYEAQRAANENREADMAQKLQESAEREEALKNSLGVVNKKLEQLEAQVAANPLTQIFAAAGINMDSLDLSRLMTFLKKPDNPEASCHLNGQTAQHIRQGCPPC
ncbi:uncharacterized protein LOC126791693 [Argentina anserina]|uniref:uncharacterized protein LOC126791693 n=1 Tax=Argentina anserina TaxID=57926 RepID=UPI0021769024|nr:uncharacterized protein LOC126791693 [Potentilla anserina]